MSWWGGALGGAATGAGAGAAFGPWGAGIGGAIGLVGGALGASEKEKKLQQYNQSQAEMTRYSPWTGMSGHIQRDENNSWGDAMGGLAAGAQLYQAGMKMKKDGLIGGDDKPESKITGIVSGQGLDPSNVGAMNAELGKLGDFSGISASIKAGGIRAQPKTFTSADLVNPMPQTAPTLLQSNETYKGPGYYGGQPSPWLAFNAAPR
jgi:hypothetical protein